MARKKIALVKLNIGQGSYFDELTRIHLTIGSPIGEIYSGMNLTNIRRAIKSGRLSIIEGTLGPDKNVPKLIIEDGQYKLSIPKSKPKDDRIEKAFDNFVRNAKKEMIEKIKTKTADLNKVQNAAEKKSDDISKIKTDVSNTFEMSDNILEKTNEETGVIEQEIEEKSNETEVEEKDSDKTYSKTKKKKKRQGKNGAE